ncbi:MAG TPA: SPFH domain-containing protein [Pirellulaceae bacterium]|nr:SPFH domain-containing protein [Pirellulaceae bacterium]
MRRLNLIAGAAIALAGLGLLAFTFHMLVNCIYIYEGESLRLRYKGPLVFGTGKTAEAGQYAQPGEIGVYEEMKGPGRYMWYCPIWWERVRVPDVVVKPGEVALVTSKMGDSLPPGQFLVDGELTGPNRAQHKGTLRKVLGPGRYRINNYGFESKIEKLVQTKVGDNLKHAGWVNIPTGYVGVVTNLAANSASGQKGGIQDQVLPPGIYAVNPAERQIDIVGVGFWESSISTDHKRGPDGKDLLDASGEPEAVAGSGIAFPSNDGFNIQLDFTAIWGVMPKDAPKVVETFGTVSAAEQKVIIPQSESISRINGSKMGANALLVGETRQAFQNSVSDHFHEVLKDKKLTLLYGLVRHIYIPKDIRTPLQEGYVADELKLTREEERTTKQAEGELREAEKKVVQETEKVKVETAKLVASALAEGQKKVGEIEAAAKQQVAAIDRQIAEFDAKKIEMLGKAKSEADRLLKEANSQKFDLAVKAFGNAGAYTRWQFAEGLPENIQLQLFYAGEGTLWTDLKGMMPTLPLTNPAAPRPAETPAAPRPVSAGK